MILAGGGGHTGYGYSLANHLYEHAELHFLVPLGDEASFRKLINLGKVNYLIKARGPKTSNIYFVPRLVKSFINSSKYVNQSFDVVVSTGSNFCFPPAIWAWIRNIPIVNIESPVRFTKPALTTRFLEPISAITALHWIEQKKILDGVVVGPILPETGYDTWDGGYILVTGGTYGHRTLFEAVSKTDLDNVVLQTGKINPGDYEIIHPDWKVFSYSDDFLRVLAGAEVVVTHFGSTVLEAISLGKPAVIVPNPAWTRTVGVEDAMRLAEKVNALVLSDITPDKLKAAIEKAKRKKPYSFPNGAKKLASLILKL